MKILIVSQYFWPENFRVNDIAAGLAEKGHQVTVFTGIPNYPSGKFFPGYGLKKNRRQSYRSAAVIRIPLIPRGSSRRLGMILNYLSFVISGCLLIPYLCREQYDAIFVSASSPITAALPAIVLRKIKNIPILLWVLDLWPESVKATGAARSPLLLEAIARLVRFIYRRCDRILVPARGFIPRIEAMGVEKERIRYFPNWAEDIYRPRTSGGPPVELRIGISGFRIVFAGNIGEAQGFPAILSAAEKLREDREIQWLIIGDGRSRGWVEQEVRRRELTDSVHLLGAFPPETMPGFFAAADVLLVSLRDSPVFSLTIPGKVQSYLACGRPIIAALDGEGCELITASGAGICCPPGDSEALAGAVKEIRHLDPRERGLMGERGKEYCREHFDRQRLFNRLEEWMLEVSAGRDLSRER